MCSQFLPMCFPTDGVISSTYLVFDGVKMGASISVNGHSIGTVTDQFRRYIFELNDTVLDISSGAQNSLAVAFKPEIDVNGRFMSCTGGWDWVSSIDVDCMLDWLA